MKNTQFILLSTFFLILGLGVGAVTALQTPDSQAVAANVYVSDVTFDPGTFFTGDTGTVMVYVTNSNSDTSVVVNHATFGDKNILLTSTPYDSSANIGPLQKQPFTFSVVANAPDGTVLPDILVEFRRSE